MLAKVFENGRSQAIRIPKEYRFEEDEVIINKIGNVVMITPKEKGWDIFFDSIDLFPDDFMKDGRTQNTVQARENL